jgi:hypothetical protein
METSARKRTIPPESLLRKLQKHCSDSWSRGLLAAKTYGHNLLGDFQHATRTFPSESDVQLWYAREYPVGMLMRIDAHLIRWRYSVVGQNQFLRVEGFAILSTDYLSDMEDLDAAHDLIMQILNSFNDE